MPRRGFTTPLSVSHASPNYWLHFLGVGPRLVSSRFWGERTCICFVVFVARQLIGSNFPQPHPHQKKKKNLKKMCTTDSGSQHLPLSHGGAQGCVFARPCTLKHAHTNVCGRRVGVSHPCDCDVWLHQHSEQVVTAEDALLSGWSGSLLQNLKAAWMLATRKDLNV